MTWWHEASCSRKGWSLEATRAMVDLFFSERPADMEYAKAICTACEVKAECLAEALELPDAQLTYGIRAGLEGREIIRLRDSLCSRVSIHYDSEP